MKEKQKIDLSNFKFKNVVVQKGLYKGEIFNIEDYAVNMPGEFNILDDWRPVSKIYRERSGIEGLPLDDGIVYGKIQDKKTSIRFGYFVHITELLDSNGELVFPDFKKTKKIKILLKNIFK